MGWNKEFRVVLFMTLMGVRGCSESLGLGVGEEGECGGVVAF